MLLDEKLDANSPVISERRKDRAAHGVIKAVAAPRPGRDFLQQIPVRLQHSQIVLRCSHELASPSWWGGFFTVASFTVDSIHKAWLCSVLKRTHVVGKGCGASEFETRREPFYVQQSIVLNCELGANLPDRSPPS